ncbi:MAG: hypothetical protein E7607_00720 [Ruminococcaceae bacterium]|nr:hypothetical protein [Oscillospiraceae bacterium]
MTIISLPDMNDSFSRVVLRGKEYLLRLTYNSTGDFWTFGIYTSEDTPIITEIKIVPSFPLNRYFHTSEMPDGIFGVLTNLERVGRDAFKNGEAQFVFIPSEELIEEAKEYVD